MTNTEAEALLLEYNLIKQHKPKFNILLRDDKSYPYIYVSTEHPFPRLRLHRGARKGKGRYFGPYPGAGAVRQTLNELQKLFMIAQLHGYVLPESVAALPAIPDTALHRAVCRAHPEDDYAQDMEVRRSSFSRGATRA